MGHRQARGREPGDRVSIGAIVAVTSVTLAVIGSLTTLAILLDRRGSQLADRRVDLANERAGHKALKLAHETLQGEMIKLAEEHREELWRMEQQLDKALDNVRVARSAADDLRKVIARVAPNEPIVDEYFDGLAVRVSVPEPTEADDDHG